MNDFKTTTVMVPNTDAAFKEQQETERYAIDKDAETERYKIREDAVARIAVSKNRWGNISVTVAWCAIITFLAFVAFKTTTCIEKNNALDPARIEAIKRACAPNTVRSSNLSGGIQFNCN